MSECRASKRAKKANKHYALSQLTINLSEEDRQALKIKLDNYLNNNNKQNDLN